MCEYSIVAFRRNKTIMVYSYGDPFLLAADQSSQFNPCKCHWKHCETMLNSTSLLTLNKLHLRFIFLVNLLRIDKPSTKLSVIDYEYTEGWKLMYNNHPR